MYCWCRTPEGVVSPRRAITRAQPPFLSTATNILLIKSSLRFESRATAVSVVMSPRYHGDKYRSCLHPRLRKCACQFFAGDWACEIELCRTGFICFPWRQRSWSCGVFRRWIFRCTLPFPMKMACSTQLWYILASAGLYVFQWDRLIGLCSSGSSLLSQWRDAPLMREFQMWRRRCKHIDPHWFRGSQMRFWWMWPTISWTYWIIYPVRLFNTANFNQSPPASYFQQFTGS